MKPILITLIFLAVVLVAGTVTLSMIDVPVQQTTVEKTISISTPSNEM